MVNGLRVLHLYGTPYEMGKAHGRLLRDEVRATVRLFRGIDDKPRAYELEAERRRRARWIGHMPAHYPDELRGLAEGAGLPVDHVEFAHSHGYGWVESAAVFLAGGRAARGPLLAQSSAFIRFTEPVAVVYHPADGHAYMLLTCPGCLQGLAGMNERGVAVVANPAYQENFFEEYTPAGFLTREALRQSATAAKAVSFLQKPDPADFALFFVAGRGAADGRVVERTPDLAATFRPDDPAEPGSITDCLRRSYRYTDPRLQRTVQVFCGFFADAMVAQADKVYRQLGEQVTGTRAPSGPEDVVPWFRSLPGDVRDDYLAVFLPNDLDFWLARGLPGEARELGARFQKPARYSLKQLLEESP